MTAATYTFTLSAAQSAATSMVVAMRAKPGSSIPGNASRWQGGVMPQITLNWAAGATTATATVNTAPNSAVDGNAEYEWYKVSSTPSDLTLTTTSLPTITITDDDSAPPTSSVIYNQTIADSGYRDIGPDGGTIEFQLNDSDFKIYVRSDTDGKPGIYIGRPTNGRYSGYFNSATQDDQLIGGDWNFQDAGVGFSSTPAKIVMTATTFSLFIGNMDTPKKTDNISRFDAVTGATLTNVRVLTNGAAVPVKITKA